MLKSKRALALALGSLGLLAAADLPTDIQLDPVTVSDAAPITFALDADDIEIEAPSFAEEEMGVDKDITLRTLVGNVRDYGTPELDAEMECLASAVYNEARGEPLEGQLAVAQVVLNRAQDRRWPSSICDVVYQRYQFSFTFDGKPDVPASRNSSWKRAEAVAVVAATDNWQDVTDEAVFFHATYVNPRWKKAFKRTTDIGRHIFYR
ncbi:MAG: cell wall hydrolase [Pacificimonas sp.]